MSGKLAAANQMVTNVMVNGQEMQLETEMPVSEVRALLQDQGIMTDIANAESRMVNSTTVEFVNQRGENGVK